MAQVAQGHEIGARIDRYLDYLFKQWRGVPAVAAEWDDWDDVSQLTFVLNWGVPADRLGQLEQWAKKGLLTPEQGIRYDQLMKLVARHRSTLERLLAD